MDDKLSHQARLLRDKVLTYFRSTLITPKEEQEALDALDNTLALYEKLTAEKPKE